MKRVHIEVIGGSRIHAQCLGVCEASEISQRVVRTMAEAMVSVHSEPVGFAYERCSRDSERLELRLVVLVSEARPI